MSSEHSEEFINSLFLLFPAGPSFGESSGLTPGSSSSLGLGGLGMPLGSVNPNKLGDFSPESEYSTSNKVPKVTFLDPLCKFEVDLDLVLMGVSLRLSAMFMSNGLGSPVGNVRYDTDCRLARHFDNGRLASLILRNLLRLITLCLFNVEGWSRSIEVQREEFLVRISSESEAGGVFKAKVFSLKMTPLLFSAALGNNWPFILFSLSTKLLPNPLLFLLELWSV